MKLSVSSTRRNSGLSCSMSRGDSSRAFFISTLSITAVKIFSRGLCWWPIVTQSSWPRSYLRDLSPSRIVAVLRPRRS